MNLSTLPKIIMRKKKRLGRGVGSGKGMHTVGRGTKGQKAREDVPLLFEGTKSKKSLVKRLPYLRGKGKFKSLKKWKHYTGKKVVIEKPIKVTKSKSKKATK